MSVIFFWSWLLPWVAPGSSPHCSGAVTGPIMGTWLCLSVLGCVPSVRDAHAGVTSAPSMSPLQSSLLSLFPTFPASGCGGSCSSFSKRICQLHHENMNKLCAVAGVSSLPGQSFPLVNLHSWLFLPKIIFDTGSIQLHFLRKPLILTQSFHPFAFLLNLSSPARLPTVQVIPSAQLLMNN